MAARRMALVAIWLLAGLALRPAQALDQGTVAGDLELGGERVAVAHSVAMMLDNGEGLRDSPRELRILLTDREVPPDALLGIAFPPVRQMAMAGEIKGLLIELDPADLTSARLVPLMAPAPGFTLATISLTRSSGVFEKLEITGDRVTGKLEGEGSLSDGEYRYALEFGAPLFHEPPVTADLKGKAAQDSPQVKAMRAAATP